MEPISEQGKKALEFHKKSGGKLEIKTKTPIRDARDLSLAYTPGVAEVSRAIAQDKRAAYAYTIKRNAVAVVTDGSAVLGLGNVGPLAAIPVMEGKAILFKELADIDAFPICLDTQDTEEIVRSVKNIAPVFGGINLEDIAAPRCFDVERRLREELDIPVIHNDQSGSAVVVLAALMNALELKGIDKRAVKIVVNGAGAAGTATAKLLIAYGIKNLTVCDSRGIVSEERRDLSDYKRELARLTKKPNGDLVSALRGADVFIGLSAGGVLRGGMIRQMSEKPVVFALANPVPEIMPEEAESAGAWIVGTGRSDFPNQINNVLAFPGLMRGALDRRVQTITDIMLIHAAERLARCVKTPSPENILPNPLDKNVSAEVAKAISAE